MSAMICCEDYEIWNSKLGIRLNKVCAFSPKTKTSFTEEESSI